MATLTQFYLQTGATHRHSLKTPRKKKVATSLNASPSVALPSSTRIRASPDVVHGSHLAPARVAAPRHERGFRHYLSAAYGGGKLLMLGVEGGNGGCSVPPTQSRDRGLIVPAPGRRLALLRRRRQQGPGRGCADSTLSSLTRRKNSQ